MCHRSVPTLINITEESLPAHTPLLTGVGIVVTEGCELGISEVWEAGPGSSYPEGEGQKLQHVPKNYCIISL